MPFCIFPPTLTASPTHKLWSHTHSISSPHTTPSPFSQPLRFGHLTPLPTQHTMAYVLANNAAGRRRSFNDVLSEAMERFRVHYADTGGMIPRIRRGFVRGTISREEVGRLVGALGMCKLVGLPPTEVKWKRLLALANTDGHDGQQITRRMYRRATRILDANQFPRNQALPVRAGFDVVAGQDEHESQTFSSIPVCVHRQCGKDQIRETTHRPINHGLNLLSLEG